MSTLDFKDILIIKQFFEKGFRQGFFNQQEIHQASVIHDKISVIIADNMKAANESGAVQEANKQVNQRTQPN